MGVRFSLSELAITRSSRSVILAEYRRAEASMRWKIARRQGFAKLVCRSAKLFCRPALIRHIVRVAAEQRSSTSPTVGRPTCKSFAGNVASQVVDSELYVSAAPFVLKLDRHNPGFI
jgi:hypothetical protein